MPVSLLDELGEGAVDRGPERLDVLVEVDRRDRALGDALGRELVFLFREKKWLAIIGFVLVRRMVDASKG